MTSVDAVPVAAAGPQRPLHPRQRWVWTWRWALVAAIVVASVAGLEWWASSDADGSWPTGVATGVVAVAAVAATWWGPLTAYRAWWYRLGAEVLELHHGVAVRSHSSIPYFRVQHIDVTAGPVERALGLATLVVRTASSSTDARIPGIGTADVDDLRDVILARTGRDAAV